MNGQLSFWAQSLDNEAPDHMEVDGTTLLPDDQRGRERLVNEVTEVTRHAHTETRREGISLRYSRGVFVLEVPSDERDEMGRIAPIVCLGQVPEHAEERWPSDVVAGLNSFAGRIGRTISAEVERSAQATLDRFAKKSLRGRILNRISARALDLASLVETDRRRAVLILLAAGLSLIVIVWLVRGRG